MMDLIVLVVLAGVYSAVYPEAVKTVKGYFEENAKTFEANTPGLSLKERKIAAAIVAPEVSTYSIVVNFVELKSMMVTYVYQGGGNFSIGIFQMKPSFAEMIEQSVATDAVLSREYADWIKEFKAGDTEKARRRARLTRLDDDAWQMRYLTLFYKLAEKKTQKIRFSSDKEKLKYFATLYNSGLNISPQKVKAMQSRTYFPHFSPKFNYADVAVEFYDILN